jgi:predicted RNase H-like HicB family nuclease
MRYVVVIHKDDNSDYGVTVPDLPGCFSAGDTLDQALSNSVEAIECHVEALFADDEELPTPKPSEDHIHNPDYDDGIFAVVDIDLSNLSGATKRINISMPENVLSKIDRFVSGQGGSRSAFLAEASLEYMANHSIQTRS